MRTKINWKEVVEKIRETIGQDDSLDIIDEMYSKWGLDTDRKIDNFWKEVDRRFKLFEKG